MLCNYLTCDQNHGVSLTAGFALAAQLRVKGMQNLYLSPPCSGLLLVKLTVKVM